MRPLTAGVAAIARIGAHSFELCAACLALSRHPDGQRPLSAPFVTRTLPRCSALGFFLLPTFPFGSAGNAIISGDRVSAVGARVWRSLLRGGASIVFGRPLAVARISIGDSNRLRFRRWKHKWFKREQSLRYAVSQFLPLRRMAIGMRELQYVSQQFGRKIDVGSIEASDAVHVAERIDNARDVAVEGVGEVA